LTPAQAAFLAALPQRPTAFNPWKNWASAQTRQQAVLRRMADGGSVTPAQYREAREERLVLRPRANAFNAPHFVEMVSSAAADRSRPPAVAREASEGGVVQTTLDFD